MTKVIQIRPYTTRASCESLAIYCTVFSMFKRTRRELAELKSTRRISEHHLNSQEFVKACGILEKLARQYYRDAKGICREFGFPMTERGMDLTRPLPLIRRRQRGKRKTHNGLFRNRYGF